MTTPALAPPTLATVPESGRGVTVTAAASLSHRCPHRAEFDSGSVRIAWTITDRTLELHQLAAYLRTWASVTISHEELTHAIRRDIASTGVTAVTVETRWNTAGIDVHCTASAEAAP